MKIDPKQFVQAVRQLADDKPDFVYQPPRDENGDFTECVYVEKGEGGELEGSCLIGCALLAVGVPAADLDFDRGVEVPTANDLLGLELPAAVVMWALKAQRSQDEKIKWSDAVNRADRYYPLPFEYRGMAK